MDTRIELQKNDRLLFPGMECTIDHSVGRGSNVIVYVGHYRDHQNPSLSHRVLIRELFPYDREGGIWRNPDGDIHIETAADPVYDLNRMTFLRGNEVHIHPDGDIRIESAADPVYDLNRITFLRGNEVHIRLLEKIPADMDVNINTYEYHNTLYSLVGYSGGRNLYEELGRAQWQDRSAGGTELLLHTVRIMKGALDVLQSFHQAGYLHLDINPDNILLIGEGEKERVTLIDYNSVHTINEIEQKKSVYYSTKEGFTAPEVQMGRFSRIGEWTDLYSLTAMLYVCLTGRKLTPLQMTGNSPLSLDPAEFPFLKDCPETVLSLLRRITQDLCSLPDGSLLPVTYVTEQEKEMDLLQLAFRYYPGMTFLKAYGAQAPEEQQARWASAPDGYLAGLAVHGSYAVISYLESFELEYVQYRWYEEMLYKTLTGISALLIHYYGYSEADLAEYLKSWGAESFTEYLYNAAMFDPFECVIASYGYYQYLDICQAALDAGCENEQRFLQDYLAAGPAPFRELKEYMVSLYQIEG